MLEYMSFVLSQNTQEDFEYFKTTQYEDSSCHYLTALAWIHCLEVPGIRYRDLCCLQTYILNGFIEEFLTKLTGKC